MPGGTQRRAEEGREEEAHEPGQCYLSSGECRRSQSAFGHLCRHLGGRAPKTVETLHRDFEQTIAYYKLAGVARQLVRTTSLLERTNRELRRKFRQVCCFGSPKGAEVGIFLQVKRLNARWSKKTWWETSRLLYFDFLTLHP